MKLPYANSFLPYLRVSRMNIRSGKNVAHIGPSQIFITTAVVLCAALCGGTRPAFASVSFPIGLTVPDKQEGIEIGFSPEGSAEQLVLKAIGHAHKSIRLAAYTFTSPSVVRALVAAKHNGVDVAVIVDEKNNLREDRSGKARTSLDLLVNAGIPTRTVSAFAIHHDKYLVVDGKTLETGSFNYTDAAARYNSENTIVIWNAPTLAREYLDHWQSRWDIATPYRPSY